MSKSITLPPVADALNYATMKLERELRDCPHNTKWNAGETTERPIIDWKVVLDGEHRATWKRRIYARGWDLADIEGNDIMVTVRSGGLPHHIYCEHKGEMILETAKALRAGQIPTAADMVERRAAAKQAEIDKARAESEKAVDARVRAAAWKLYGAAVAAHAALKTLRDAPQGGAEVMLKDAISAAAGRDFETQREYRPPTLAVTIEGGVFGDIVSDMPQMFEGLRVLVIDYDTEDNNGESWKVVTGEREFRAFAYVHEQSVLRSGVDLHAIRDATPEEIAADEPKGGGA